MCAVDEFKDRGSTRVRLQYGDNSKIKQLGQHNPIHNIKGFAPCWRIDVVRRTDVFPLTNTTEWTILKFRLSKALLITGGYSTQRFWSRMAPSKG
jgi:hypothetical protein